jgi:hypothetical protein
MNFQQQEQFYQMMTRLKSRAASTPANEKENETVTEVMNGLIVTRPAEKIEHISEPAPQPQAQVWNLTKDGPVLESKAASTQYETVVKKYDMSLPSTGDQVFKCGIHDFETKNVTEFNRHVENHTSKAASVSGTNKIKAIHDFINGKH